MEAGLHKQALKVYLPSNVSPSEKVDIIRQICHTSCVNDSNAEKEPSELDTSCQPSLRNASIAQWIEHWSRKPGVVSSILTGGSEF